jgi:hypothetical protein
MAFPSQSASFADIALAIQAQIAATIQVDPTNNIYIDPNFVRMVVNDDFQATNIAEPLFFFLRFYGPQPDTDAGAGRLGRPYYRILRAFVFTRQNIDVSGDQTQMLTAPTTGDGLTTAIGHFRREEELINALDDFWPIDTNGNLLTIEPLHSMDASDGPPVKPWIDKAGIARSYFDYQIRYVSPLNTKDPAPVTLT